MRNARFSISVLAALIALIAADCALLRLMFSGNAWALQSSRAAFFMVNVLALGGLVSWSTRGHRRPFLSGFLVTGLLVTVAYQAALLVAYEAMYVYQRDLAYPAAVAVHRSLVSAFPPGDRSGLRRVFFYVISIPAVTTLLGLPQCFAALAGAFLASRWSQPSSGGHGPPS
jgi:hypothetical protein